MLIYNGRFVELQPGDLFGVYSDTLLAYGINIVQWLWSTDCDAKYNHTGIIQDATGKTFEALWTIREGNLFKDYEGCQVIIARYTGCDLEKKIEELKNLKGYHLGQWYPWWRIFMHIVPPLAKINVFKRPVCSEATARYEYFLKARHEHWAGTKPDTLVDEWNRWRDFTIMFEGALKWQQNVSM